MVELTKIHLQAFTVLSVITLGVFFVLPFLSTLLFAAILAYASYPIYRQLKRVIPDTLASFSVCFGVIGVIALIVNYGVFFILNELGSVYFFLANLPTRTTISPEVSDILRLITTKTISYLSEQISSIPSLIISIFLFFVALFYFLKEGKTIFGITWKSIPLPENKRKKILKEHI